VIRRFKDKETERIANGRYSKRFPFHIQERAKALLDRMHAAESLQDMTVPPSLRFEKLRGIRRGQFSIRVNDQYRICFNWADGHFTNVELTDYH
jgi:proteic killer suppression protein